MEVEKVPGYKTGSTYYTCAANEGFFYRRKTYGKNGDLYLVCIEKNCLGRAKCNQEVFLRMAKDDEHNHLPDAAKKQSLLLKRDMVSQAVTSSDQLKTIFLEKGGRTEVEAAFKLTFPSMSQTMRRERRKAQPGIPRTLEELGNISQTNPRFGTVDSKPFGRGTIGTDGNSSVLFLSEDLKQLLSQAKEVYIDGTFKTRPQNPKSSQLLTLLVVKYGYAFPCAFSLMSNRRVPTYNVLFSELKKIVPSFNPQLIMTDYEAALIRSLDEQFPNAHKTGCYFHYCQAIMRQTNSLGMNKFMRENGSARKILRLMLSMPLLPANDFEEGLDYINSLIVQHQVQRQFRMLMSYYQRQWMQRVGADCISVYQRPRRTNNDAESFHAALSRHLRVHGPNVWQFVDTLRDITATTIRELTAFIEEGLRIRTLKRRRYMWNDNRIREATALLISNHDVPAFLEYVSHSSDRIIQAELTGALNEEEYLLGRLAANVPAEFRVADNQTDESEEEIEEVEEVEEDNASANADRDLRPNAGLCMICGLLPPSVLLQPCNHFGLCEECSIQMQRRREETQIPDEEWGYTVNYSICPMDRIPIEAFLKIIVT